MKELEQPIRARRVAALYDIHGNLPALDAVLREVEREAPDVIVVGGDCAQPGPMPRETLDRLTALRRARFLRGNTDRELVEHYDGDSPLRTMLGSGDIWVRRGEWAAGRIDAGQRDFLAALPAAVVLEIEGLGPTLFCHASPRSDEEPITCLTPEQDLAEMVAETTESLVICGHTHVQFDRSHRGRRVVNAGSVGMHLERRPGAYWLLLGPDVELRRTSYDLDDAVRQIRASGYPEPDDLIRRLTAYTEAPI